MHMVGAVEIHGTDSFFLLVCEDIFIIFAKLNYINCWNQSMKNKILLLSMLSVSLLLAGCSCSGSEDYEARVKKPEKAHKIATSISSASSMI